MFNILLPTAFLLCIVRRKALSPRFMWTQLSKNEHNNSYTFILSQILINVKRKSTMSQNFYVSHNSLPIF